MVVLRKALMLVVLFVIGMALGGCRPTPSADDHARPVARTPVATAQAGPSTNDDQANVTVYTTRTGACYHRAGCSALRKSAYATTVSQAKRDGYRPCIRCNPPE